MVSIAIKINDFGSNVSVNKYRQVSIFAGVDADHRAHCGFVTMLAEEAEDLQRRVDAGEVIEPMNPGEVPTKLYDEEEIME